MSANTELVTAFCRAWSNRDVEEILGYFTEDSLPSLSPGHWKPVADAFAWRRGAFGEAFFDR